MTNSAYAKTIEMKYKNNGNSENKHFIFFNFFFVVTVVLYFVKIPSGSRNSIEMTFCTYVSYTYSVIIVIKHNA